MPLMFLLRASRGGRGRGDGVWRRHAVKISSLIHFLPCVSRWSSTCLFQGLGVKKTCACWLCRFVVLGNVWGNRGILGTFFFGSKRIRGKNVREGWMDSNSISIFDEVIPKNGDAWKTSGFPLLLQAKHIYTQSFPPPKIRKFLQLSVSSQWRSQTQHIFTPPLQSQHVYNYLRGMPFSDRLLSSGSFLCQDTTYDSMCMKEKRGWTRNKA